MGTSTTHRSPNTPRWRIVSGLYDAPATGVDRLLAEVFNAAEGYPAGLADSATLARVESLLQGAAGGEWRGDPDAALGVAREAIRAAQATALGAGHTSFYGDLADRAIHATFLRAARQPEAIDTPNRAIGTFLGNLLGIAIDHVISRDLSAHLGGGRLSTATDSLALRRDLAQRAQSVASDARVSDALAAAAAAPRERWPAAVSLAWGVGAEVPPGRE